LRAWYNARMHTRYEYGGTTWIDLESPTKDEVAIVAQEFGIDLMVAEELLLPTTKPRVEFHGPYTYAVMHFPALRHTHRSVEQEVDFVVGKNFIVTARYDTIDPLHKFSKVFEVNSVLGNDQLGQHAEHLFFYMLKKLYKSVEHEIEHVRKELATIEHRIFSGEEVAMVEAISSTARDLLNVRQTIEPHREILLTLEHEGARFFGEEFAPYLRALSNEYYRVHSHVMRSTEVLHELRETNNSLLSTKQNEIMKRFSILAFTTFPLTLVATLFAMGTRYTPIVGVPYDFWIIIGLMAFGVLVMFWYFKSKKWL
jgi:magnesium transporter